MKLNKMPAPAHDSAAGLDHLAQQTQLLRQKYLGRQGAALAGSRAATNDGYAYPPSRAEFNIQMVDETKEGDLIAEGGHGVPLSNFLNA